MALYRWQHILSIWLNQHEIIKHKAGGWRKNGSVYSSILSPLLLLATCRLLQTVGKYLMEALIQNRWRRERTRGRTRRFVSNRFGQNVSPISRFASVWLPLAKLGEQRNSMNMLSQGLVGWEFEFQQHQPTAYSCNIYAPALKTKKNEEKCGQSMGKKWNFSFKNPASANKRNLLRNYFLCNFTLKMHRDMILVLGC